MTRRIRPALGAILENINGIQQAIKGRSLQEYAADWTIRHAVERGIEIISEACKRIPGKLRETRPEVEWKSIIGVGNVLRHEYDTVVDEIIFDAATQRLDQLKAAVLAIEAALDEPID